ncbi:cyclic nucleotide-binding domain-containing protein [Cyclospora cayetanensis]|uniref:Cyclic nucleotide-binding domain-containing protein n=1 Tax=Cyclospora cayetanensis TaxID=88456 RepID=A0A1D3D5E8_9EIME|nr:cyclic nucleotide-binding domain-containing protein [Cyclospora cayetanensis]
METPKEQEAQSVQNVPDVEKKGSRGMMSWLRQSSIRRFRSTDTSRTPRDHKADDTVDAGETEDGVKPAPIRDTTNVTSLAAMFMSVQEPVKRELATKDRTSYQHPGAVLRTRTAQELSFPISGAESPTEPRRISSNRSVSSDPGEQSDSNGLPDESLRIHSYKSSETKSLLKEEKEHGSNKKRAHSSSSYGGICRLEFVSRTRYSLCAFETEIRRLLESNEVTAEQQPHIEDGQEKRFAIDAVAGGAGNVGQKHFLAQTRRDMDKADESTVRQMKLQGEQLILVELLQTITLVKRLLEGIKYKTKLDSAIQHDLRVSWVLNLERRGLPHPAVNRRDMSHGEEEQLKVWQRQYGALQENKGLLENLYKRVCTSRNGVLRTYHDECIRLNQSVQLLTDRIANTISETFAEFEEPPALDTLLYAFNSPAFTQPLDEEKEHRNRCTDSKTLQQCSVVGACGTANRLHTLFPPLSLEQALPRHFCVKSVPPGLALMSSEAEIERYEALLWAGGGEKNSAPPEGGWGSFRVFEQWLVDSMKWQWRDALMYSKLHERHQSIRQMIAAKKVDIDAAVRLRLTQLWWGRLVEMQGFHSVQAEQSFRRDLRETFFRVEEGNNTAAIGQGEGECGAGEGNLPCRLLTTGTETEHALMWAEDMRASLLRIMVNPAYVTFVEAYKVFRLEPSTTAAHLKLLNGQIERANALLRRYADTAQDAEGYQVLEKECSQLEVALALLQEEARSLEGKISFRQAQLGSKRHDLTQAIEKLGTAFDVDNKKLASIEAQWDSAVKTEELIQDILPSAEKICSSKERLGEERMSLEAERAQLQAEWQRLKEAQREFEEAKNLSKIASTLKQGGKPKTDLVSPSASLEAGATEGAPQPSSAETLNPHADRLLSDTPSKSFVGRIFGTSSRPSSPRESKATRTVTVSDVERADQREPGQRLSGASFPDFTGSKEQRLPLRHSQPAPLQQPSGEGPRSPSSEQEEAETARNEVPTLMYTVSPVFVKTPKHEQGQTSSPRAVAARAVSAPKQKQHEHQLEEAADVTAKLAGAGESEQQKKRKPKDTVAPVVRKGRRKKKSVYSKLRSALSLSQLSHRSEKRNEAMDTITSAAEKPESSERPQTSQPAVASKDAVSSFAQEGNKQIWADGRSQSSVLASIPNIFDSIDEEGAGNPAFPSSTVSVTSVVPYRSDGSHISPREDLRSRVTANVNPAQSSRSITYMMQDQSTSRQSLVESEDSLPPSLKDEDHRTGEHSRLLRSDSSSAKALSSHKQSNDYLPHFGSRELNVVDPADTAAREIASSKNLGHPSQHEDTRSHEIGAPEAKVAPLIPFPSMSAGSPAEFPWESKDIGEEVFDEPPTKTSAPHASDIQAPCDSKRRRSDISGLAPAQNTSWMRGTRSSRALAFDRSTAGYTTSLPSRYVDEDDRIELFLSNGQADLTTAVMSSCIFSLLDAEERQHCVHLMTNSFVQIPKGCRLIQRGDKIDTLYFLVSGSLGMTEPNGNTTDTVTATALISSGSNARRRSSYDVEVPLERFPIELGPGAFVTPRAFVREEQTNHSLVALRPCTLQKLSYHSFQQVISACIFRQAPQVMNFLGFCPILESLTRRERVQIAALMKWRIFLPEELICHQGEICNALLLVVHGDNINALALLHDAPSDVTIAAAAPDGCVIAILERRELQECLGDAETILNRRFGNTEEAEEAVVELMEQTRVKLANEDRPYVGRFSFGVA